VDTSRSALDAASSIDAVQQEIIESFTQVDSNVGVHKTGYFNHTYTPDLVLQGPRATCEKTSTSWEIRTRFSCRSTG
jgi:hypothetical protein